MTTKEKMKSPNKTARIAGFLYLIHMVIVFSSVFVRSSLIESGDVAATANNIMASESLFRLSFVSDLIGQIAFILLVLVLYKLLKPVNKTHASLMVIFFLVSVPITMLNQLNQFAALLLLSGADYLTVFEPAQLHAQAMLFLDLHEHGIFVAQIFWGLWLLPLGYLVFKSGFLPKILGVLLMIGCFGYLIELFQFFLFPGYEVITYPGIAVATIAEVSLMFWLLLKGVDVEQWEKRALESA